MSEIFIPLEKHDKRVTGLIEANTREVLRRREAEKLLKEAEEKFRFYYQQHLDKTIPLEQQKSWIDDEIALQQLNVQIESTKRKAQINLELADRLAAHFSLYEDFHSHDNFREDNCRLDQSSRN